MFFGDSATNKREGKSLQRLGLTVVLALSAFLNLSWLTREAYANVYYAATRASVRPPELLLCRGGAHPTMLLIGGPGGFWNLLWPGSALLARR